MTYSTLQENNTYITDTVESKMANNPVFNQFVKHCQDRFIRGDWGDITPQDREDNKEAENDGIPVLGIYSSSEEDLVIESFEGEVNVKFLSESDY